jgi:hypothetical protein
MVEPVFMKLGTYVMALEPILMVYFINPSHQSVCLYVYPPIVARQQLSKNVTVAKNTRNDRRIVGCIIFHAGHFISRKVGDSFFPELLVTIICFSRVGKVEMIIQF